MILISVQLFNAPTVKVPKRLLNFFHYHVPRRYSAAIKRPFAVRYDPFTCTVEVLDQPCRIQKALSKMREDLRILQDALEKLSPS